MGMIPVSLLALGLAAAPAAASRPAPAHGPRAATSSVPSAALAPDGTLWLAYLDQGRVYASSSPDLAKTFTPPAAVSPPGEAVDANGEARPKVALGPGGEVYVSYTRKGARPFTGDVRLARRLDDGRFAEPVTVNDDGLATGHRFDALAVAPDGAVHLAWIDKRDLEAAKQKGAPYRGAALYEAVSRDGGKTFSANARIKDEVCECCRLALAWDGAAYVVLWRDILEGGIRDHSIARLDGTGRAARRATDDGWRIDGCPHHGPALAVGPDGAWHLAWYTGEGKRGRGTFYRSSPDRGQSFTEPLRIGSAAAGRPALLAAGSRVWLAWKEPAGGGPGAAIHVMRSDDRGATWSAAAVLARSSGISDHPQLVGHGGMAFLSWFTAREGYRLIALR